jgi:hypothetical protein
LLTYFQLLQLDEDACETYITQQPDTRLKDHWYAFCDLAHLKAQWHFPAWVLLREPGLLHHLKNALVPSQQSFTDVKNLLTARLERSDEIPYRQALQESCPVLLKYYLDPNFLS